MIRRHLSFAVLVIATGVATAAQTAVRQPPQTRDTRVVTAGRGEISGMIMTDEETPRPVKRAEVRAIMIGGELRTTYTDASGAFSFGNLAIGRYTIEASKPGFVRTAFGAKRHDRPGTPVTLTDTERTQTLRMRMARGSVITGRILDEFGQPAQGARVRAQLVRTVNGERTLSEVPVPGGIIGEAADDRGIYRLYGLPAGDYVISATPRSAGSGDIRRMGESEIRAAEQAVKQPQSPLEPEAPPVTLGYTSVFFPGVTTAAQASPVSVKVGEERQGVDFVIQFVRTSTIEGMVVTPASVRPESVELLILPRQLGGPSGGATTMIFAGSNRRVSPDGKFAFTGITPGSYTITARVSQEGASGLWANADVEIDGQPVTGVALSLQDGLTLSGRLAFDMDGVDAPTLFSRARLNLLPAESNGIMLGTAGAQVSAPGAFTFKGVIPGRYRVSGNFNTPEANWTLKSAIIKGKDALDVPVEIAPGDTIGDAVLTFTNRTQELTGMLQDAAKRPATDFTVVIFPADKTLWGATRRVRTIRPDTTGKFTFANIPAGAYRIAAVQDIGAEDLRDLTLLEELAAASLPVTIADGEKKVQDIRLASGG